ncbi:g197 [Yersinia phage phiR1-37]|uniref:hypothetical protein n=1 Tax=Yersinia phage phiR1-37 TaxID=331278 RepID=UPI00022DBD71|nr:hypothetical protein phiR1-37_gp197 [Yersinia phage phiR1-37]CCE26221.1 g197 [Yersinia phage phiR1-37]
MDFIYSDKLFSLMEEESSQFKKVVILAEELFNSAIILKEADENSPEGENSEAAESFKEKIIKFLKRIIETVRKYLIKLRDFAKKIFAKILGKFERKSKGDKVKLKGFANFEKFVEESDKFANGVTNIISFVAQETSPEAAKASLSYNGNADGMKDIPAQDKQLVTEIFGNNLSRFTDLTENEYTAQEVEAFKQKLQMIMGQFNSTNEQLLKTISHLEELKAKIEQLFKLYKMNGKQISLDMLTRRTKALFNNVSFLGEIAKFMNNWLKIHSDYSSKLVSGKE